MKRVFFLFFFFVQSKYLIEYTRRAEHLVFNGFSALCLSREGKSISCDRSYQETEHHAAENIDLALKWINLNGRYETFRFTDFGKEEVHPIDGFKFVAMYKCEGPVPMFQIQFGEEIKIIHVKQEQVVPVFEWTASS